MEEFVFNLDKLGRNYEYYFGHVKLQIFDYRKYQRMLRHINKDVIQKGQAGDESQPKQKTDAPVITYERPEAWCQLEDFPEL